jgi:hypothetical protein
VNSLHRRPIGTHEVVISILGIVVGLAGIFYGIYFTVVPL